MITDSSVGTEFCIHSPENANSTPLLTSPNDPSAPILAFRSVSFAYAVMSGGYVSSKPERI